VKGVAVSCSGLEGFSNTLRANRGIFERLRIRVALGFHHIFTALVKDRSKIASMITPSNHSASAVSHPDGWKMMQFRTSTDFR
jgi:hypothetical protein